MDYKIIFLSVFLLGDFTVYGDNGLDEEDKNVLLQAHNYYRSLAAEDASNMERMIWNQELEKLAEQHVNKCHVELNDNVHDDVLAIGFTTVGESQAVSTSLPMDYHLLVGKWYEEGKHYEADTKYCAVEEHCNRYLQLIWATTADVGCAIKKCKHAVPSVTILVCHYGPGITSGTSPYKPGLPCSACPSEHHVCRRNLCSTEMQRHDGKLPSKVHIPHFVILIDKEAMFCYEVQATNGLAYNLFSNENVEITGYFTYNQDDQRRPIVLLDTMSMKIKSEDGKLPNRIVLSGSKQEIKIGDVVLSVRNPQSVIIMEKEIVAIPTSMVRYSEVVVKMETIDVQFVALFTNDSQLQLIFPQLSSLSTKESDIGLIGNFYHGDTTINIEEKLLTLQGFDPIKLVQRTLTNQPRVTMNNQWCLFMAQAVVEDFESHYTLSGL